MNNRYFICKRHKKCIEAGYRWAYWHLEAKGVVKLGGAVDVAAVFAVLEYWNPGESKTDEPNLSEFLSKVKAFLEEHEPDGIEYVEDDFLLEQWELGYEWREVAPQVKVN